MHAQDLTGQRFGHLTALRLTDQHKGTSVVWECRCDCGRMCTASAYSLKHGNARSCGCLQDKAHGNDITGQRFGRLTALRPTEQRSGTSIVWECRCDCGRNCAVSAYSLKRGNTRSCGCLQDEARRDDISGQRRGQLTAVQPTDKRQNGMTVWEWRCDCGASVFKAASRVGEGKSTMCPACARRLKSAQAKAMADGETRDEDTGILISHLPSIREGRLYKSNSSGVRGVTWHAGRGKWQARIHEHGKSRSLGYYSTIEEAAAARQAAVKKRYGAPDED